jgi:hypothetical protein
MARPLVFNLVVSNVPGPQQPLYLLGRRIREIYPYVPLSPQNHAVSLGLISYDGGVYFGLVGDRDAVPDLDALGDAVRGALREQPVPRKPPSKPAAKSDGGRPARRKKAAPKRRASKSVASKGRGRGKAKKPARRRGAPAKGRRTRTRARRR